MNRKYTERCYEALDQLSAFHHAFPGHRERLWSLWLQLVEEGDNALIRGNMRGHVTASMLVLDPTMSECLLVDHLHHKLWLPPGGHLEEGTLAENALREVAEETGLTDVQLLLPHPVHIDTHPITPRPAKNEGAHYHHDMLFLGLSSSTEIQRQEEEVADVKWWSLEGIAQGSGHAADGARNALSIIQRQDQV